MSRGKALSIPSFSDAQVVHIFCTLCEEKAKGEKAEKGSLDKKLVRWEGFNSFK